MKSITQTHREWGQSLRWVTASLVMVLLLCADPLTARAHSANLWAANSVGQRHAVPGCKLGSPQCNRCTRDVAAGFRRLGTAAVSIEGRSVNYLSGVGLPPAAEALSAFAVKSHFQGFTRVDYAVPVTQLGRDELMFNFGPPLYHPSPRNSEGNWFAHSFGPVRPNGITLSWKARTFFPWVPSEQRRQSSPNFYFKAPGDVHVGGIHSVGKYLLAAIDLGGASTHIAVLDLSRPLEMRWEQGQGVKRINIGALGVTRASSVAAAQMFDGSYLVAVQERSVYDAALPWKPDLNKHDYSLFRVESLDDPTRVQLLARPKGIPLSGADNMAAVTDCDSGEIYLVAAGANDFDGPNFWSLLRVTGAGLQLSAQGTSPEYSDDRCQTRAAGTAFTSASGTLVAACIGKSEGSGVAGSWNWEEWTAADVGVIVQ